MGAHHLRILRKVTVKIVLKTVNEKTLSKTTVHVLHRKITPFGKHDDARSAVAPDASNQRLVMAEQRRPQASANEVLVIKRASNRPA